MESQRSNGHTVSQLTAHIVWSTKYRYPVLTGDVKLRCRTILILICDAEDVEILKGVVSSDHVNIQINYLLYQILVILLRGRSSRKLQQEFPELNRIYWGLSTLGVGVLLILLIK